MFSKTIFSARLKRLRSTKKLTMLQLSLEIGVSKQTVGHWETEYRTPPLEKTYELADYFNVSIDYLVGRTDNPEINK